MTPNTGFQIALSDVNTELVFPFNSSIKMDDAIVRSLTGNTARLPSKSTIFMSNLQGKTAFGGISSSLSVSNSGFGNVTASVTAAIQSDMIGPNVDWSYSIQSTTGTPSIFLQPSGDGKSAVVSVFSNNVGNHSATIVLSANVSFNGQQLGTKDRTISFTSTVQNAAFIVAGSTDVNATAFGAQTATTTLTASSNVAGSTIVFTAVPSVGTLVQGNTITFTRTALLVGQDNAAAYSLTSRLLSNTGQIIAEDVKTINVRANFLSPDLILSVPASTNNVFANVGPISSTVTLTTAHGVPSANIVWTTETISGDLATLIVAGDKVSANLHLPVATFGAKKSVTRVKASLEYANGYVLNTRSADITLRTVGYGLSFVGIANATIQSYTAVDAGGTAQASWQAGTFSWDTARLSGDVASISSSIFASTATLNLSFQSQLGLRSTIYRINPVIKFDDVVVANVENQTALSVTQDAFSFDVSVDASNTVIGTGTVSATLQAAATHNIPGGYVVWSKNNGSVTMTSNTSAANLSISTTTVNSQTVTLTGTLFDSFNRQVAAIPKTVTLNAYAPSITFSGDVNYETPPGYTSPQLATGTIVSNIGLLASGATFNIAAEKVSGSTLSIGSVGGTATRKTIAITASASSPNSSPATTQGTYRVRATVVWNGVTYQLTSNNSTFTATLLGRSLTIAQLSAEDNSGFLSPVEATATIQVSDNNIVGSNIVWNVPAGTTIVSQNNTTLVIKISRTTIGTSAPSISVTASAFVGGSLITTSNLISATPKAQLKSANLSLDGPTSSVASAVFGSTASITLTANVDPTLVGHSFIWTITPVSGELITPSGSGNSRTFDLTREGNGTALSAYDVSVRVRLSGVDIATSATKRINLSATAELPQIFFGGTNADITSYLPPVGATTIVSGYTVPAGVATTWTINSGGSGGTTSNSTHFSITATTGADIIGTVTNEKTITATLRTPSGALIGNYTGTFSAKATRKDPQFNLSVPAVVNSKSWSDPIAIQAYFTASVDSEIAGSVTYVFTNINTSGVTVTNPAPNVRRVSRSTSGTAPVTTNSTVKCEVFLSGVKIGEQTKVSQLNTIPYYMQFNPEDPVGVGIGEGYTALEGELTTTVTSNHENFASTPITWNFAEGTTNGINVNFGNSGGVNNQINMILLQGQGNRERSGTITATFFDGTANRVKSTSFSLSTPGYCLDENMWLDAYTQAKNVTVGMKFMTWLPESGYELKEVEKVGKPVKQLGVELQTKTGAVLRCSRTTPFALESSKFDLDDSKMAPDMLGEKVMVDSFGMIFWDEVISVIDIGEITTIPISFGGRNFAGGLDKNQLIYSHNLKAT